MESTEEDISTIAEVFPDIGIKEITSYFESIPEEHRSEKISLTLRHFFCLENENVRRDEIDKENAEYAAKIKRLFPSYSLEKILKELKKYDDYSERLQLVLKRIVRIKKRSKNIDKKIKLNNVESILKNSPHNLVPRIKIKKPRKSVEDWNEPPNMDFTFNDLPMDFSMSDLDLPGAVNLVLGEDHSASSINRLPFPENVQFKIEGAINNFYIGEKCANPLPGDVNVSNYPNQVKMEPDEFGNQHNITRMPPIQNRRHSRSRIPTATITRPPVIETIDLIADSPPSTLRALLEPDNETIRSNDVREVNQDVIRQLREIFQDADPEFLEEFYLTTNPTEADNVELMIEKMLNMDYPKRPPREPSPERECDFDSMVEFVTEMVPDADPNYIRMKCIEFAEDLDGLREFANSLLEKRNYPTLKEYQRKQQMSAQMKQYISEFSVENFVKLVPDPISTFQNPERNVPLDYDCQPYIFTMLKNKFDRISVNYIKTVLSRHNNLTKIVRDLKAIRRDNYLVGRRKPVAPPEFVSNNIPLLQEIAFYDHEQLILDYINEQKAKKEMARSVAKAKGQLLTCQCCYDEELMPEDSVDCVNNCVSCSRCIIKSVEIGFSEGKVNFPCLTDCGAYITIQTLQHVLPSNLFSKVAQKKALAEVKAAGMEDLEYCPFCDFASIPAEGSKIFTCLNPDCMKESCRSCKETSHVPYRCDEVEHDADVKKRTYIENKMTEALLRKCYMCGTKFYKEEGCNKMTCTCGAKMCYLCGQPVQDYSHFNGPGGDQFQKCPLYSDTNQIHHMRVLEAAQAAKQELEVTEPGTSSNQQLKIDPTADIDKHFQKQPKKFPQLHLQHIHDHNPLERILPQEFNRLLAPLHPPWLHQMARPITNSLNAVQHQWCRCNNPTCRARVHRR